MEAKIFTHAEASAQLEQVRRATRLARERLEQLRGQLTDSAPDSERALGVNRDIEAALEVWDQAILELGALPKGLWTVDFDSGEGYYFCWTWDESELSHYHTYEAGFSGRKPLSAMQGAQPREPVLN